MLYTIHVGGATVIKCVQKVYLTVSECHEPTPLLLGLFLLCMSAYKPLIVTISSAKAVITVIVSAKCLFTARAASHCLKKSSFSVISAQDEVKFRKKEFWSEKKKLHP